ncbi:hypothetical protein D9M68_460260 [compost metagenome]
MDRYVEKLSKNSKNDLTNEFISNAIISLRRKYVADIYAQQGRCIGFMRIQ